MAEEKSFVDRFAEALVKNNFMKEAEAESLIQEFHGRAKGNIVSFLLSEGILEHEEILKALGSVYGTPSFDVRGHFFNHQWLLFFPKDLLIEKALIPLEVEDDLMTVVMSNPEDEDTIERLGEYVSYNVNVYVGIEEDIVDSVKEYYDEDVITAETEEQDEESGNEEDDSDIVDYF